MDDDRRPGDDRAPAQTAADTTPDATVDEALDTALDTALDEAEKESFPASDPQSSWAGPDLPAGPDPTAGRPGPAPAASGHEPGDE